MVGSLGFEPRLPTPQAGILDQARLRPHEDTLRKPTLTTQEAIINTISKCTSAGLSENTIKSISYTLKQLGKETDLLKPEQVKAHIAAMKTADKKQPLNNATKQKHANNYDYFIQINGLKWVRPKYKIQEIVPLIPTTDNINKIIAASSPKFAAIFTILRETGLEAAELASMTRSQIDAEKGEMRARGCKGHNSRTFRLKPSTAELLRIYMYKYKANKPFPLPKIMGEMWRRFRNRTAKKLNQPDLTKVQMRNLRNYSAAQLYDKIPDPILMMRHLGHKKLETTMHYLRGMQLSGEEE